MFAVAAHRKSSVIYGDQPCSAETGRPGAW